MMEISKKLLNEVLNETITKHDPAFKEITDNCIIDNGKNLMINYKTTKGYILGYIINIYELAHLCKEWAVNLSPNKHALSSYPRWGDIRNYKKTNGSYYICQHLVSGVQFEAETEPEAIFKACEWILEQVEKK